MTTQQHQMFHVEQCDRQVDTDYDLHEGCPVTDDILKRERPDLTEDQRITILQISYIDGVMEEQTLLAVAQTCYPAPSQAHYEPV